MNNQPLSKINNTVENTTIKLSPELFSPPVSRQQSLFNLSTPRTSPPYHASKKPIPPNYPTYLDYLKDYKYHNIDN